MKKILRKELTLLDVFCIATGAMISSGLFILPGMAFARAGPAVILSYIIAGLFCIPTVLSMSELTTAMPKAGGDYFYIMRGFGPLLGTVAGFCAWFSLILKGAFALIGMGAYLVLITSFDLKALAVGCCIFFVALNLAGVKEAARFQVLLVLGLLVILASYIFFGLRHANHGSVRPFFSEGIGSVLQTASFVFVSYAGLIKVAALAEEIKKPWKTIPLGMLLSLSVTMALYAVVVWITILLMPAQDLKNSLMPISDGAAATNYNILMIFISIAAFMAFISTANSGIMTASRYPLGMSRDRLLPPFFQRIAVKTNTPYVAILFTGLFMVFILLFLKIELLVKVASSILILLYIFTNLTLVLFRESKLLSYRPRFRAPLYPFLQIIGILGGMFLLIEMGTLIVFLMLFFIFLTFCWYELYAKQEATRDSALLYVLERLVVQNAELRSDNLLSELKDIVIQRDKILKDDFYNIIEESPVLDIEKRISLNEFYYKITDILSDDLSIPADTLYSTFMEREKKFTTMLREGFSIPHIIVDKAGCFRVLLVRAKAGILYPENHLVFCSFVIVSSLDKRRVHLEMLAAMAEIAREPDFDAKWLGAANKQDLKNVLLLADRTKPPGL